ncbi:hypothetical protein QF022_002383 [Vogesella perlucida]|nr:hypothetical protein [Vogesella perlucida]
METIKRKVRVTIEKEFIIEMPSEFGTEQYLEDFRSGLWHVESVDDVAKYAARMAAYYGGGAEHDGLGLLDSSSSTYPRVPDVKFVELEDYCEEEIITDVRAD